MKKISKFKVTLTDCYHENYDFRKGFSDALEDLMVKLNIKSLDDKIMKDRAVTISLEIDDGKPEKEDRYKGVF